MQQPELAVRQFGSKADDYLRSTVHAAGADLERVVGIAQRLQAADALDLGCGAGHVSYALARADMRRFEPRPARRNCCHLPRRVSICWSRAFRHIIGSMCRARSTNAPASSNRAVASS